MSAPKMVATLEEFLKNFDESVHGTIKQRLERPDVDGIVRFDNVTFDSSRFGERTACIYGPGCTFKTVEECFAGHLHDLPSMRMYAQDAYAKPKS